MRSNTLLSLRIAADRIQWIMMICSLSRISYSEIGEIKSRFDSIAMRFESHRRFDSTITRFDSGSVRFGTDSIQNFQRFDSFIETY